MRAAVLLFLTLLLSCAKPANRQASAATELPVSCTSATARDYLIQAWDLVDDLKRDDALRLVERAHAVDPACVLVEAWRGYLLSGDVGSAVLAAAAGRAGTLEPAERRMVDMLVASRAGDPAGALAASEDIADLVPSAWRGHALCGRRLAGFHDREREALAELRIATRLAPEQAAPWQVLSQVFHEQRRFGDAADAAVTYSGAKPGDRPGLEFAALQLWSAGRFEESSAFARRAVEADPGASVGGASPAAPSGSRATGRAHAKRTRSPSTARERTAKGSPRCSTGSGWSGSAEIAPRPRRRSLRWTRCTRPRSSGAAR